MSALDWPTDAPPCASGKRPYRTEAEALDAMGAMRRAAAGEGGTAGRRPGVLPGATYACPVCRWWHLATHGRAVRRSTLSDNRRGGRRAGGRR